MNTNGNFNSRQISAGIPFPFCKPSFSCRIRDSVGCRLLPRAGQTWGGHRPEQIMNRLETKSLSPQFKDNIFVAILAHYRLRAGKLTFDFVNYGQ